MFIVTSGLVLESKPGDCREREYVFQFMPDQEGLKPGWAWHRLVVNEDGSGVCATDSGGYDAAMVPMGIVMEALAHVRRDRQLRRMVG